MDDTLKEMLIRQLQDELDDAKKTDAEEIAAQIQRTGFHCLMCGRCCRRESGDNRVALVPEEIRRIQNGLNLEMYDVAEPLNIEAESPEEECSLHAQSGMIDEDGNIHTFGWMLRRKENRDCCFIPDERSNNLCSIYELRPLMCSTYPFYMEGLKLRTSECEGLGKEIGIQQSRELAHMVLERYLCELKDTILTYENYSSFTTGLKGKVITGSNLKQGYLNYIVHNSEGKCRITRNI
ncbi:YkgJ family cysteine cluster protein [Methanolobus sp. WCC5]|jgi:Fe-S-cluster containining protein|uniref:YkgJ family cysteine cluster protein n=1 Tax=Methanolobus sp. WCC5 TaxID=3125785 RepID=UPI003253F8C2